MEDEETIYELKCSQCQKVLGESSIEDGGGHLCTTCDQENRLPEILAQGKTMDCTNLAEERPEKLREIVKVALFENPEALLSLNFSDHVEQVKADIQTELGIENLEHSQKVDVLQKVGEEGDILEMTDKELKDKVTAEKEALPAQIES